ncbi:MAG: glycoside hydrolase family 99-like domain-containing protein [Leptothrix sp. (in: b-proteobacteria)]
MSRIFSFGNWFIVLVLSALLYSGVVEAKDVLVIGNSLTRHPPAAQLGWQGDWGMAASSMDRDYVHQLANHLESVGHEKVKISLLPAYPLESAFFAQQPPAWPAVETSSYDYILVELGDNIDFRKSQGNLFETRYDVLLNTLSVGLRPAGRLVCLGKWWPNAAADASIRTVCERHGGAFLALAPISVKPENHARHERDFFNQGVGEHPGDRGMTEIAQQLFCVLSSCTTPTSGDTHPDIGVYYFPGWQSQSRYWKDIQGQPDSRSPNRAWPEREPLLGYYAEEDPKVAEQHINWASQYGITFFAYDWYWNGKATYLNHAIDNFLKAPNNNKLKFSMLWANHGDVPRSQTEFDAMVDFWVINYLKHPQFYKIDGRPVIFVYSAAQLDQNARKFGATASELLKKANLAAQKHGLPGLFFVATTNLKPNDKLELQLSQLGFSAYSGWNYVAAQDQRQSADYDSMVKTYLDFYSAAADTSGVLPYIVPASPGWDSRPWEAGNAYFRLNSSPEKFQQMLTGARNILGRGKRSIMNIVMIEAWNEFGEGAYIEPTKKWQFEYLSSIKDKFQ